MENNPKKSKALIITIIIIVVILLAGYLIVKNRDAFGVKTSATIAKIFSPLMPSENNANLTTVDAQAGEDIAKGDSVSVFGTGTNNNPIVVKTSTNNGTVYGYANQDIKSGYAGKIVIPSNTGSGGFWNSISSFITNIITPNNSYQCNDGKDNDGDGLIDEADPNCHVDGNLNNTWVKTHNDESTNAIDPNAQPTVTVIANPTSIAKGEETSLVSWTSTNTTSCDAGDKSRGTGTDGSFRTELIEVDTTYTVTCKGPNGATSGNVTVYIDKGATPEDIYPTVKVTATPSLIKNGEKSNITWTSTNAKECKLSGGTITGTGIENATGVDTGTLTVSTTYTVTCTGDTGLTGSDNAFVEVEGSKIPDLVAGRITPTTAVVNTSTTLLSTIKNIGNSATTGGFFPNYFIIKNTDTDQSFVSSSSITSPIAAKSESVVKITNTFAVSGNYSIVVCADQISPTNTKGVITEASETNNCSDVVNFKVTDVNDPSNLPDLVANKVTPLTAFKNTPVTLSSIITNRGYVNTNSSFSIYLSIKSVGNNSVSNTSSMTIPSLPAGISNTFTKEYTFRGEGQYSIIACADKNSATDKGKIIEANEDNNCSTETILTISEVIPPPGSCTNNAVNYPECTVGPDNKCINSASNPPICDDIEGVPECADGKDNDGDGLIDIADPDCSVGGVFDPTRFEDPSKNPDGGGTPEVNKCLLIAQRPLDFTDAEKAKLAELLRKFYVIAPTLKTTDDINMIYREVDKDKSFVASIEDLTQKCYLQTDNRSGYESFAKKNPNLNLPSWTNAGPTTTYNGPSKIYGNPWYKADDRASYITTPDTSDPSSQCTGTINYNSDVNLPNPLFGFGLGRGGKAGMSCKDYYNSQDPKKNASAGSLEWTLESRGKTANDNGIYLCEYQQLPNDLLSGGAVIATGCIWKGEAGSIYDYEKILNVY